MSTPSSEAATHAASLETDQSNELPWMQPATFPLSPAPSTYGYRKDKINRCCSQDVLIELIRRDNNKRITLVWTPDSMYLTPPEEVPWLFDVVRARDEVYLRELRGIGLCMTILWGSIGALLFAIHIPFPDARLIVFILGAIGIIPLIENSWSIYQLRLYTPQRMVERITGARYIAWARASRALWMLAVVSCIGIVGVVQLKTTHQLIFDGRSVTAAGIFKSAINAGEWWRLLTGTVSHVSLFSLCANIMVLLFSGRMLEVMLHRALMPLVFFISALSGSI